MTDPFFVIGNPRSGTTLLRLMLTCHEQLCVPPEAGWLVKLHSKYASAHFDSSNIDAFLDNLFSTPKIEAWSLERSALLNEITRELPLDYSTLASRVYLHYAKRHGKSRWGDKNNFYLNHIETLYYLFPNAYFIHIVRDGRDVACSYRDLSQVEGLYAPKLPNSVWGAAYDWTRNLETIERSFNRIATKRLFTLHYEDLVRDTEATLRMVCSFLGEDYDVHMLSFAEENQRKQLEPDMYMGWKAQTKKPVTDARVSRWKKEMFEEDVIIFERVARSTLKNYNYNCRGSTFDFVSSWTLKLYSWISLVKSRVRRLFHKLKHKTGISLYRRN